MYMDVVLIEKLRKGDRQAQKVVFETMSPILLTVCRRYTPVRIDPLDTLHDSFIKIFEKIKQFDPDRGSFDAWAKRIAINTALEKLKKKSYTSEFYIEHFDEWKDEFDVVEDLKLQDLLKVIETLPDGYKQVFNLYEIEGFSHKEIGEMLGIKEGSSRSNLARAKNILKELLSKYNFDQRWMAI